MSDLPSFGPRPESPDAALGSGPGIAVSVPETFRSGDTGPLPLCGVFRLPKAEAAAVDGNCLKAVVVVVRQPVAAVCNPAEGALLFDDDLVNEGETVRGYFNVDLARIVELRAAPGTYWVSASILHHLSDVHTVEVA